MDTRRPDRRRKYIISRDSGHHDVLSGPSCVFIAEVRSADIRLRGAGEAENSRLRDLYRGISGADEKSIILFNVQVLYLTAS